MKEKNMGIRGAVVMAAACFSMQSYALTEVSGDYTISGDISYPVVFTGDANLTIAANANTFVGTVTNDGHNVTINLESGCQMGITLLQSLNGAKTKINFKGGRLKDAGGWDKPWFSTASGCEVELASVNGNSIWITHPNFQRKFLTYGDGRVFTSGTGRFLVRTAGLSGSNRLFLKSNLPSANYLHTGGTCYSGPSDYTIGWIDFDADNQMPPGRVEIGHAANLGGAWVNLAGKSHVADQIVRIGNSGGITNMTTAVGTLVFGNANAVLDCPVCGNVKVEKTGVDTTLTVKSVYIPALVLKAGTVLVKPDAENAEVKIGSLSVSRGATLTVDGCVLEVAEAKADLNTTVTCINGGKLRFATAGGTTNILDATGWGGGTLEKTGSGTLGLGADLDLAVDAVNVTEGTLKLGAFGSTNRFWRVSFKKTAGANNSTEKGWWLAIGPFRLFDRDISPTDGGGNSDSKYGDKSSAGIPASQLAANEYICSRLDYTTSLGSSPKYRKPPYVMFWQSTVYSCQYTQNMPSPDTPSSWVVMTYRIPDDSPVTHGYDVKSQQEELGQHPGTWSLESSPDGTDGSWELMDEQSGQKARAVQCWYHGSNQAGDGKFTTNPYPISSLCAGGGISVSANVKVAPGATLDASLVSGGQEVSLLTVDYAGGGTLKGVRFASVGTINLINVPQGTDLNDCQIPFSCVDVSGTQNLSVWTANITYSSGITKERKLYWDGIAMRIRSRGFILCVQ